MQKMMPLRPPCLTYSRNVSGSTPSRPRRHKSVCPMNENKLLFVSKTDHGARICIKFVRRHSQAAHEKCAKMGIFETSKLRSDTVISLRSLEVLAISRLDG
jgi:hypothetical protein